MTEFTEEFKKELFKVFDEYMEERNKLENQSFTVKATGGKKEELRLFTILMKSRYAYRCFKDEGFMINGIQKKALDKANIKYGVV